MTKLNALRAAWIKDLQDHKPENAKQVTAQDFISVHGQNMTFEHVGIDVVHEANSKETFDNNIYAVFFSKWKNKTILIPLTIEDMQAISKVNEQYAKLRGETDAGVRHLKMQLKKAADNVIVHLPYITNRFPSSPAERAMNIASRYQPQWPEVSHSDLSSSCGAFTSS